jgi:hypothetical protein
VVKKFKTLLAAVITALVVVAGVGVSSVPAQAVVGSDVYFYSCQGSGCDHKVWIDTTDGQHFWLPYGGWTVDVYRVRPYSIGQRLRVEREGTVRVLACGASFYPSRSAVYSLKQQDC